MDPQFVSDFIPFLSCGEIANLGPYSTTVATGNLGNVKIQGLAPSTTLVADWFDTYKDSITNPLLKSDVLVSNMNGDLIITPPLFQTGANNPLRWKRQEFGFKIHLPGQMRSNPPVLNSSKDLRSDSVSNTTYLVSQHTRSSFIKNETEYWGTNIQIYPNPGNGKYTVYTGEDKEFNLEILNAYGSKLKSVSFTGKMMDVNIENCENGIYFFHIRGARAFYSQKVVKE